MKFYNLKKIDFKLYTVLFPSLKSQLDLLWDSSLVESNGSQTQVCLLIT